MLEVIAPKITDISNIKGISTLLALPMLCVAYFLQSGPSIEWDQTILFGLGDQLPPEVVLQRLITIFVLKSLWISFFGMLAYGLISYIYVNSNYPVVQMISVLMVAVALFGLFCATKFPELQLIDTFWFYSLIVWGVFLQTMKEQLDAERKRIDEMIREKSKERQRAKAA